MDADTIVIWVTLFVSSLALVYPFETYILGSLLANAVLSGCAVWRVLLLANPAFLDPTTRTLMAFGAGLTVTSILACCLRSSLLFCLFASAASSLWLWIPLEWFYLSLSALVTLAAFLSLMFFKKHIGVYVSALVLSVAWAGVWAADVNWLADGTGDVFQLGHMFDAWHEWLLFAGAACFRLLLLGVQSHLHASL